MSIIVRIYLIVGLIVLTSGVVATVGIVKMNQVGMELGEIAHEDMPLTANVTAITIHQLEQAILLERALRASQISAGADFESDAAKFAALAKKEDAEILQGEELADHAIKHAISYEARAEFTHVLTLLKKIEGEHKTYDDHALEVIEKIRSGDTGNLAALVEQLEAEQEQLDHELAELLFELERFTEHSAEKAFQDERAGIIWMIVTIIVGALIGGGVGMWIGRGISQPIANITEIQVDLANGNLEAWVPEYQNPPEVASLCKAMYRFKQEAKAANRYREEQEAFRIETRRKQRAIILGMADNFEDSVGGVIEGLSSSATELSATSNEVSNIASRTAERSASVKDTASEAGADLQEVNSAVVEVDQAIKMVASRVAETSRLSDAATKQATETASKVSQLNDASAKIKDIVALICDIAEQTNLLALNATIEAARAGEAGKGFAVVAGEVKSLAAQTQNATEEISAQVSSMLSEIDASTSAVNSITEAVDQTNANMTSISAAIEQQASMIGQVAGASEGALQRIQGVISDISNVADDAISTSGATEELQASARELSRNSEILLNETTGFIRTIRTDGDGDEETVGQAEAETEAA